jgi:hypothetical protein
MTPTAIEITDARIEQLATSAAQAGDHAMVLICKIALAEVVLDEDTTIDSLLIAAFLSSDDKREIGERWGTADEARAEVERVIADAAAQD